MAGGDIVAVACATWAAVKDGFAMANPEAAIADARPVGLRVLDLCQGSLLDFPSPPRESIDAVVFSRCTARVLGEMRGGEFGAEIGSGI